MQDALLALTRFWTDRGAMIAQPFNTEVGAGTYNPATIMRVLGPEPWRVAYVEPSVRPDDSRYGENPNRMQTFTQFQVVLKPDPGDPQEVYLESLRALGVDIDAHDIRFVEDDWKSPALGAWGLGWEVWLDGMEITQFTYFQQAGGINLDPISVEITYGVERILMALQGVTHFKDIAYAPGGISYGEVFGQAEYEMSRYYLDDADVETNRALYEGYRAEARRCLDAGLPVPANTYVLKCSHAFNVLDSRGAISTTERATAFRQMRGLAHEVAEQWMARRAELGHPLGVVEPPAPAELPASGSQAYAETTEPATLLFEIGVEELPAAEVGRTSEAVRAALDEKLGATRLAYGRIVVDGTPRRIVAIVEEVAPREPDAERTVRGPRVSAAFDAEGRPTKAVQGFARGQGVAVEALERVEQNGTEFVAARRLDVGRRATEVLSGVLGEIVAELRSGTNMRWSDPTLSFSRPVRWLLALLGTVEVPVAVSSLRSGRTTRVFRTAPEPVVEVPRADGYVDFLRTHGILLETDERRRRIAQAARELAASVSGTVDVEGEGALLDEVTNLVEAPDALLGAYDRSYLELPAEILTTVMKKHQRYVPIRDSSGALLPHFVAVANGSCDHDVARAGNEAVLRARFEDALFFWRADLEVRPDTFVQGLDQLAFEARLGSVAQRARRIADIAYALSEHLELDQPERETLARAGELAKFDLATQMVVELTSLAGTMAREYARRAGEPEAVAQALYDMELPRVAGGALPGTRPGALLALADRLDLLAGLFAVGAQPTGSSDPFALRRAALGVVNILRARPEFGALTVRVGLRTAAERIRAQGVEVAEGSLSEAYDFVVRRFEQQLLDAGAEHTFVQAVLPLADRPARADETLQELVGRTGETGFDALVTVLGRVRRIIPEGTPAGYDPGTLVEPSELALHDALGKLRGELPNDPGLGVFADAAGPIVGPIDAFFDTVLVMAPEEELRAARLGLLASIDALAAPILDWSAL